MRRGLFLENAFALVKEELSRGLNAVKDDLHEEAQPVAEQPRTITCRMNLNKQLAHGPPRFDPARNKDAFPAGVDAALRCVLGWKVTLAADRNLETPVLAKHRPGSRASGCGLGPGIVLPEPYPVKGLLG